MSPDDFRARVNEIGAYLSTANHLAVRLDAELPDFDRRSDALIKVRAALRDAHQALALAKDGL